MPWVIAVRSSDVSVAPRGRRHVKRGAADAGEVGVRAGERDHVRVEKDVGEPLTQHAAITERTDETRLERANVEHGLVDVEHENPAARGTLLYPGRRWPHVQRRRPRGEDQTRQLLREGTS
jgi:hypothetical protein